MTDTPASSWVRRLGPIRTEYVPFAIQALLILSMVTLGFGTAWAGLNLLAFVKFSTPVDLAWGVIIAGACLVSMTPLLIVVFFTFLPVFFEDVVFLRYAQLVHGGDLRGGHADTIYAMLTVDPRLRPDIAHVLQRSDAVGVVRADADGVHFRGPTVECRIAWADIRRVRRDTRGLGWPMGPTVWLDVEGVDGVDALGIDVIGAYTLMGCRRRCRRLAQCLESSLTAVREGRDPGPILQELDLLFVDADLAAYHPPAEAFDPEGDAKGG